MAVRNEVVRLSLQDAGFTSGMVRAASATSLLDRALGDLDGSSVRVERSLPRASQEVERVGKSSKSAQPDINQLTGRLRLLADAAAVLGPSLVPIGAIGVPAVAGLASQMGFAALGMGTLVAATQGVGDALKAVNKAALEPTAENLEKARIAMSHIGPEAQTFVREFDRIRPTLTMIRDAAAAGWFPGLTDALGSMEQVAPRVAAIFEAIGKTGGDLVAEGAAALAGPEWDRFMAFVQDNAPQTLEELGRTIGNVASGLADLWMAFDPLSDGFSSWMLSASRSFADWADGLSGTEGFRDFVDYIRENGPKVADAALAIGNAVVQIVEAAAPLGGPSLEIIETFAKVVGAIADSDLGTPILAGAAALAFYNRALAATVALQTRLGMTPGGPGGVGLFGFGFGGRGQSVKAGLGQLRNDLGVIATTWATAGAKSEREAARMTGAVDRTKASLSGVAKSAGPAALGMGALTLATTDVGDSLVGANTAMLTMAGTMAGPWGAAAGLVVGQLLDARAAVEGLDKALASGNGAAAASFYTKQRDALGYNAGADGRNDFSFGKYAGSLLTGKAQQAVGADLYSLATTGETASSRANKNMTAASAGVDVGQYMARKKAADEAAAAELRLSGALAETAKSAGISNAQIAAGVQAITNRTNAALGAFDAETQWRQAMKAAGEQAAARHPGIRGHTEAARENREMRSQLAAAWNNQSEAVRNNEGRFKAARRTFIDTAVAMGVPKARAKELADQLLQIPEQRKTKFTVEDQASGTIRGVVGLLGGVRDKTVTVTTVHRDVRVAAPQGRSANPTHNADGGTVPRTGRPYADRHLYLLADGEEVISNRYGQADRHRELLKAINANRLANGGTVGLADGGTARRLPGLPFADLPAINLASASLKGLNRALRQSEKALDKERSQREAVLDKMHSLQSDVTGGLRSDLFGREVDPWRSASLGGSIDDIQSVLRGDIKTGRELKANIAKLKKKGLKGSALADLLANATPEQVAMFARDSTAEVREYQRLYNVRSAVSSQVGAAAGSAAFGKELAKQTREMRTVAHRVERVEKAIRAEHREDRKHSKRGAGNGSRNRRRG